MGDRTYSHLPMNGSRVTGSWPLKRLSVRGRGELDAELCVGDRHWFLTITHRYSGKVVRLLYGRSDVQGVLGTGEVTREVCEMLRKVTAEERAKRASVRPNDAELEKRYPTVWQYLVADSYPDGQVRQRSTIMLITEGDVVKLCLNDRDNNQSLWVTGSSLGATLKALEAAVTSEVAPWRENKPYEPRPKKSR